MPLLASWWLVFLPNCKSIDLSPRDHADLVTCSWDFSSPYHNFAMCIRSLSEMAVKLDELSIVGGQDGISYRIFLPASCEDYEHLLKVFANLRKIYLNINAHGDKCPVDFAGLGRLIISAQMLHSLDLNCVKEEMYPGIRLVLARVFKCFTWPHLKHFGLSGFILCTDKALIDFFESHRATLESVSLKSIYLRQKNHQPTYYYPRQPWKHFFDDLRKRSIIFRSLTVYELCDCSNRDGKWPYLTGFANPGTRVLQYLRDGGLNPFELHVTILSSRMVTDGSGVENERSGGYHLRA